VVARHTDAQNGVQSLASLAKLEEFFGQKPKLEYPRLPYKSNLVTVETELEGGSVWLQFMPHEGWAQLRVVGKPFSIVKLDLLDILRISVRKRDNHPALVFTFDRAMTSDLSLSIKPNVMLFWGNCPNAKAKRERSDA
jgi:hypothetical protein